MTERGTFETLLAEVGQALLPLREALASPEAFVGFLTKLGWHAEDIPQPLVQVGASVEVLYDLLRKILGDGGLNVGGSVAGSTDDGAAVAIDVSLDDIQRGIQAVTDVVDGIKAIETAPAGTIPAPLLADGFATEFPQQLLDHVLITYLTRFHPRIGFGLKALGVVKSAYAAPAGNRPAYVHQTLDFSDLPRLLDDPSIVLKNAFGWGEPTFDAGAVLSEVDNLLTSLGLSVHLEDQRTGAVQVLTGAAPPLGAAPIRGLVAIIFERVTAATRMSAELRLVGLPASGPALPGLALFPTFTGTLDFTWQLDTDISLTVRSNMNVAGGLGLKVRPGTGIDMVVGFEDGDAPVGASGSVDVKVGRSVTDGAPHLILGSPGETRLQYRTIAGIGGIRLANGADLDVFIELDLEGLEFVIDAGESDGFIAKLLPDDGISFGSDLAIGMSHRQGFYFRGTSNLELSVPAHVQLGPVEIQSLLISAVPDGDTLPIGLGATFKAALGPLQAVVEGIGLKAVISFPDTGGNLGPLDLDLGFLPPRGVGLSLDTGIVKGGGYLAVDAARGEYAGALELTFANLVSIKAIGIITTKAPDGSPGFSLLIIMSVEFPTGIQLGFGFTLLALGGLVGLNRTMNLQALTDGVRSGSLTSVMFPRDIVANAPKIISDLRTFFPQHDGTFLIGPMVKLGWGTPTLVSLSMGVIIEIPGSIAILGVLKVALPAEEAPIIQLQVQFVGAIEPDKKRLWFFASLYDSRVAFITLDGEMGLLVAWGDDANFVVSVGGFHPRFSPPPLPFPSPRRLSIPLLNNPLSKLTVEGYFAVTSNTAQFGARVEAYFGLSALNVSGHLAFDALFQFTPFHFVIEISASLSVKVFGVGLFSVGIGGTLEGPTPWHVLGHGSISLLFWDIDVDFETTWGDSRTDQLEPVNVMDLVELEMGKPGAWKAVLPDANKLLVTLRELPAGGTAGLVLHPTGLLRVSQQAVPLDLKLDKVGNRGPTDVNRVVVSEPATGLKRSDDAYELFAPAQFRNFSDAEKLSQPAFGREKSGLVLMAGDQDAKTSGMVKRVVRYEETIIDDEFKRHQTSYVTFFPALFVFFMNANAAAKLSISAASQKLLTPFEDKVVVSEQTYAVAFQATNQAFSAETATFQSAAGAHGFITQLLADDPTLADTVHVIPSIEVFAG